MNKVYVIIDKTKASTEAVVRVYGSQFKAFEWAKEQLNHEDLEIHWFPIEPKKEGKE